MTDSAVVKGEFVTYSHLKTRKTFSIVIEFPEEEALHVLNTLGSPIGGNSKPVAIALLKTDQKEIGTNSSGTKEQIEGEKLRTRAVLLCKQNDYQQFCLSRYSKEEQKSIILLMSSGEKIAKDRIYIDCNIKSRSELSTNIEAQHLFHDMLDDFESYKLQNIYTDNLNRI